jgi:CheY-like chemotaxis protein
MVKSRGRVLVVDDDRDTADIVEAVLAEEGFTVSLLHRAEPAVLRATVERLEPDCILLDGGSSRDYGLSWDHAAWLRARARPIPVVMFTGHEEATREARRGESERSKAAAFAAILPKPFDLDALAEAVARAVAGAGRSGSPT